MRLRRSGSDSRNSTSWISGEEAEDEDWDPLQGNESIMDSAIDLAHATATGIATAGGVAQILLRLLRSKGTLSVA